MRRVLLVDDDIELCDLLREYLTAESFDVDCVHDGEAGVDRVREGGLDVIVLDVMMPNMDGPSTLLELRKLPELANTPAMFMTAKVQPQEIEYFKSLGALDVVPKPFDPMSLSSHIQEIWEKN